MKHTYLFIFIFFIIGCRSTDRSQMLSYQFENEYLDTLVVRAEKLPDFSTHSLKSYQPSATRTVDLIHTSLDISFDWEERAVLGKATLSLRPYFYETNIITLDAVNFEVNTVYLSRGDERVLLDFQNDGQNLTIVLDQVYTRNDTLKLVVDYTAFPELNARKQAYSIGSDQGLFFIDPDRNNPIKPTQIWTQGETEYNSRWFPTIDKPNERCTQEIKVTVADSLSTLSNGLLISQVHHDNGMRTDHWKMDLPHAPYLFALVVGDYAIETEIWKDIQLEYFVYQEYKADAREIFNHTPEMLAFFSKITGVEYPWPKYAQVIVTDFVSGAMENTTAVVFAEGFQKTSTELVDFSNDMIVAHEMFHHWFGDLVTCESWANLTLNEGFANYAEYLWTEYKYGKDAADYYHNAELNQYLQSASYSTHPLIHFNYLDKDAMFDVHSYNKGSLVLHMLRKYLGDDAFFEGIRKYTIAHSFSSAEAHDLRLAFEEVSGEDLNWFFNQWFYDKGHPILETNHSYNDSTNTLLVQINQVQDSANHRQVFSFPLDIQLLFEDGTSINETVWVNERANEFRMKIDKQAHAILFNHTKDLLCSVISDYSPSENAIIFKNSDHVVNRMNALKSLRSEQDYTAFFEQALEDDFWGVRIIGLQNLVTPLDDDLLVKLKALVLHDEKSFIRSRALRLLKQNGTLDAGMITTILDRDSSSIVLSYALDYLYKTDYPEMEKYAIKFMHSIDQSIENSVGSILSQTGKKEYLDYFENRLFRGKLMRKGSFLISYSSLLRSMDPEIILERSQWLHDHLKGLNKGSYTRNIYERILEDQVNHLQSLSEQMDISTKESNRLNSISQSISKLLTK